ncbi:hypothetical protein TSUD_245980 [Trifolium subterraneum]|uniref:Reverse transcriptase domain-containing protein n=1 Tax=Trifolium subterraneum TaxID=3900 RepID=A0A2Z6LHF6_TRISU|nr:hypothetical protein TSUD_245980 [Trifolium subterraneum]
MTFAQALSNVCDIPLNQFPKPCVKGDRWAIAIPEEEYLAGMEACKHNLHGKIIWPKGATPLSLESLRAKLAVLWKAIGKWGVMSLGKGFYEFSFSTLEDLRSVRSISSWNLAPGVLKLFAWTSNFNPSMQQLSSAQVWIRIFGLSQEYWRPKILFAIASSVGTPICMDSFTNKPMLERSFGHYARVLVDVNLAQELRFGVSVERKGFAFFVDIEYENLPDYCTFCNCVGHHFENCKRRKDGAQKDFSKKPVPQPTKQYVPVQTKEKGKTTEVFELDGGTPLVYDQVNHDQLRREADRVLEQELNNAYCSIDNTIANQSPIPHSSPAIEVFNEDENNIVGSEFVEVTQVHAKPVEVVSNATHIDNHILTPIEPPNLTPMEQNLEVDPLIPLIVQHEIDASVPSHEDNEGFKLVTSRSSKRIEKKNSSQQRILATDDQHISISVEVGGINFGDFNTILGAHEHRGNCIPAPIPIADFQQWTNSLDLLHLPTHGAFFTWANGRRGRHYTQRRLDRVICNQDWINACNSIHVSTLTKSKFDHFPLLLEFKNQETQFTSHFKFLKMWTAHHDCINVVQNSWNTVVNGCPMYVLSQKLKSLKANLKSWNKDSFGNIHSNVKQAYQNADDIHNLIDSNGPNELLLDQEKIAQINLEKALLMEEMFWSEKSKVKWHTDGDRNTAYFHRVAKIKNTSSLISTLRNGDIVLNSTKEVSAHVVDHFSSLFNDSAPFVDNGLVEEVIPCLVTDRINKMLTILPSHDEIKSAVFGLNNDSAPGPDGFGAVFFQTYWDIIKQDVINAVLQFFTTGWLSPNFNANILVLIPKITNVESVNQYRPIAIANFKFKLISKILADRLAPLMPAITSIQQRGFIKGRSIKDCICLTSEAINVLHRKCASGNIALKVDIAKAFDTLNWNFLLKILKCFGFSSRFCNWIHFILLSARISISINGKQHGYFSCSRGVRQGDPLSPLLFFLAEEVISRSITKLVREGKLKLIKGSRNMDVPSHILYADDFMLFCKASNSNVQALTDLFLRYAEISGQQVNPQKSFIYAGSISHSRLNQIADTFGFNIGSLPFTYLGVPIFKDSWCGDPLVSILSIPAHLHHFLQSTVNNFIVNFKWAIPACILNAYPQLHKLTAKVIIPFSGKEDSMFWNHSHDGNQSLKEAYSFQCPAPQNIHWAKSIWHQAIPPSKSLLVWRCFHGKLPTDDNLILKGCNLPSMNQKRFADKSIHVNTAINQIIASVPLTGNISNLHANSSMSEFVILKALNIQMQFSKAPVIKEVLWQPPILNWMKCNSDGASLGNPGNSSCGGIFRNAEAIFKGAFAINLGIQSSLFAELMGAMIAIEIAHQNGWEQLWLETDSMLVIAAFKDLKTVPCVLRNRWENCIYLTFSMDFFVSHIYREGNSCADAMANLGLSLSHTSTHSWWSSMPQVMSIDFARNRLGLPCFRFC